MAPFDAPALQAAQIEIKKINAAGGVLGQPLQLKCQRPARPAADEAGRADADLERRREHRLGHLRRRLRDAGDPGVPQGQAADGRAVHRHRPDGPVALRQRRASSRSASATPRRTRARRWPSTRISHGWKSTIVVTDNLLRYFQDVCKAFTIRFKQLGGKIVDAGVVHPGRQDDRQRRHPRERRRSRRSSPSARRSAATSRRSCRPPQPRQQDADHQLRGPVTARTGGRRARR